jgi:hypothetical protein
MSHPQPPQRQPSTTETERYARTLRNVAWGTVVLCPIVACLPPRRLNAMTFGLIGATVYSANYLSYDRSGRSLWANMTAKGSATVVPYTERTNLDLELSRARAEMARLNGERVGVVADGNGSLSQREAWKAQREKEIQDDLDVGKGFGEMITDQIWEVWNGGKKEDQDDD